MVSNQNTGNRRNISTLEHTIWVQIIGLTPEIINFSTFNKYIPPHVCWISNSLVDTFTLIFQGIGDTETNNPLIARPLSGIIS